MKVSDIKFELRAWDLKKTQSFYSVIGMDWAGGKELPIGESNIPVRAEENPYLQEFPLLWGQLGAAEFVFYSNAREPRSEPQDSIRTVFRVHYDDASEVKLVIKRLQALGLFVRARGFDPHSEPCVLDPDGRYVQLCSPNPFMNAD